MARKRVLLLTGGKYHPWEGCGRIFTQFMEAGGRFSVDRTEDCNALKAGAIAKYDAVVVYTQGGKLTREQEHGLLGYVRSGGAFVGLHGATASFKENPGYLEMLGAEFERHGPVMAFPVRITGAESMITARIPEFRITDELYLLKKFEPQATTVLATAHWHGKDVPVAYTKSYGKGRVFYLALGHDERAFEHPEFQRMVRRGVDWALGRKEREPLKVGCIGYSPAFNMGRIHLTGLHKNGFAPVAVCDLIPAVRKNAETEWPGIATYASYRKMLAESDVDLVVVITEHNSHARLCLDCLRAGKHVITEKPFCLTVDEANRMIDAAKKAGKLLSVYHNRRWDGDYMTIRHIIKQGLIGEPFQIEVCMGHYGHPSHWWRSDKKISGGAFYDWGAHIVDWVLNLVPAKLTEVSGYFQEKRVWHDVTNEDHCKTALRFENGCCALIELSSLAAVKKNRWRILGTLGGLLDLGDGKFQVVSHRDGIAMIAEVAYMESDWEAYHRNVVDHLMFDEPLEVTPESARRVIGVIEQAGKSSRTGHALPPVRGCA